MAINPQKKFGVKNLAQQALNLKQTFPNSSFKIKGDLLVWEGWVQPRLDGRKYLLCMNFRKGHSPNVWVVDPAYYKSSDRQPHTYVENRLCLYLPDEWTWHSSYFIADTMIPWACLWLYYFQIHEKMGEWLGGGKHPGEDDKPTPPPRVFDKFRTKKAPEKRFPAIKCVRLSDL